MTKYLLSNFLMASSLFFVFQVFVLPSSLIASDLVARVIILKGEARVKDPDTQKIKILKKKDRIKEGSVVQTGTRSFIKMMFRDNSQVSLGPKSQMKVTKFPKKKSGILTLIKGQMRTKVQKDLLNKDNTKNKLFIRTKTAAMGVRGTEFETVYNPSNNTTAVVTYEGTVQVTQVDPSAFTNKISYGQISNLVNSNSAVATSRGTVVSTTTKSGGSQITKPVKMNPAQFATLERNGNNSATSSKPKVSKKFQSPIPPGVSTKSFVNEGKGNSVIEAMASIAGTEVADSASNAADQEVQSQSPNSNDAPPPEGKVFADGSVAPPAGGNFDLKTGTYISPPPGSTFDPVTKTYVPPAGFGKFDSSTGAYVPPAGTKMNATGQLISDSSSRFGKNIASGNGPSDAAPPKFADAATAAENSDKMDVAKTTSDIDKGFAGPDSGIPGAGGQLLDEVAGETFGDGNSELSADEFVEQFEQQALLDVFNNTPTQEEVAKTNLTINITL